MKNPYLEQMKLMEKDIINMKSKKEKAERQNFLSCMKEAIEVHVRLPVMDKILKDLQGKQCRKDDIILPYPIMVFTFESRNGDGYSDCFYFVYETNTLYKGEKTFTVTAYFYNVQNNVSFVIVPSLLPRLFIFCENSKCEKRVETNLSNIFAKDVPLGLCLKTIRTCTICKLVKGVEPAIFSFNVLMQLTSILERFKKRGNSKVKKGRTDKVYNSVHREHDIGNERRFIYLTEKSYVYSDNVNSLGYKRDSPCEHSRREHYRTLKDGRKISVHSSTVCKGNKKDLVYVL